ncbi:MAG: alpha-galactosidase [Clostridia bacterium]|nr:alpha-galactosidase [Clostridia bacterium]
MLNETLKITLVDSVAKLRAHVYLACAGESGGIVSFYSFENFGEKPLFIDRAYSFGFTLQEVDMDVISLYGAWGRERAVQRTPLYQGLYQVDSKRGTSSHQANPFIALCDKTTSEEYGRAYGSTLIYTGSHVFKACVGMRNGVFVTCGINDANFSWKLSAGEKFDTPQAITVFSDEGLSGMSREFHDVIRDYVINPKYVNSPRPVVINNWEGTFFDFDDEKLCAIIDKVVGTGIDTFVLDDGWFGARDNDRAGLGDWVVNEKKIKGGLNTVINHAHENGFKFGLWFEPEMVNPDSDLFRAHPDWIISAPDYTPGQSRNQFCLDITRKDVRDFAVNAVNSILDAYDIDYVKWDHNRYVAEDYMKAMPADRQKECHHRYALGFYDLCERIISTHPNIFFEGCSSGGGRFDAGAMYYFPQIWTSDNADAVDRTRIQYGTSFVYPLSTMSCHVAISPYGFNGRSTPVKTRADVAHLGATGYEYDTTKISDEEIAEIKNQVKEYREMQDVILNGDLYRSVSPFEGNGHMCETVVSKDKTKAHFFIFKRIFYPDTHKLKFYPNGLNPDFNYMIKETGEIRSGRTLMNLGITLKEDRRDFVTVTYNFIKV